LNRTELQELAEERVRDAEALLQAGQWSGAYYLAGYAVECGLKACILAYIERTGAIFDDRRFSEKCWTHDIEALMKLADLEAELGLSIAGRPDLGQNWRIAMGWTESARYRRKIEVEARKPYEAVTEPINGVLPWIKTRW
jgi:HEPN domain-containing protein